MKTNIKDLQCKNIVINTYYKSNNVLEISFKPNTKTFKIISLYILEYTKICTKEIDFNQAIKINFKKSQLVSFFKFLELNNYDNLAIELIDIIISLEN